MELLNGVVDHKPLVLPRIDCGKTKHPTQSVRVRKQAADKVVKVMHKMRLGHRFLSSSFTVKHISYR
jgi:hypothetical protein